MNAYRYLRGRALLFLLVLFFALFWHMPVAEAQTTCGTGDPSKPFTVTLNWTAPTLDTNGQALAAVQLPLSFSIFMSTTPGGENYAAPLATKLTGGTNTITTGFQPNTTYYFTMTVVDALGTSSAPTNEVCSTSPKLVPATFTVTITFT